MSSKITHDGRIESIEDGHIRVRIVQQAACASCKVASQCNASEAKEKIVDVYSDQSHLQVGQHVVVSTTDDAVRQALLLGFGMPLLLMIGCVVGAKMAGSGDDTAALLGLGVLIPYYIGIWFCRKKIERRISFQIEE